MTLPIPVEYALAYVYNAADNVTAGGSTRITAQSGYTLLNPYDIAMKHAESALPEAPGAQFVVDNKAAAGDLRVVGAAWGDDPEDLQSTLSLLLSGLQTSRANPSIGNLQESYLVAGLWNGSALQYRRRYCRFVNAALPMKRKTRMHATEFIELIFRSHDPGLYGNTVNSEVIAVTSGSGNKVVTLAGRMDSGRALIEIKKDSADDPTDVTITGINGAFTITGSLTTANDKWVVDIYSGKAWLDPASGSNTDINDLVSGQFFDLNFGGEFIQVADTASSDFEVTVKWLDRYQ